MSMEAIKIGQRVAELRRRMSISHEKMSKESGINRAFIANVEEGKQNPSYEFISKLISCYSVSADWLLTGRGEMFLWPEEHHMYHLDEPIFEVLEKLYKLHPERRIQMVSAIDSIVNLG